MSCTRGKSGKGSKLDGPTLDIAAAQKRGGQGEGQNGASDRAPIWRPDSPVGLHRVLEPAGVLPQAAHRLDPDPRIRPDEVRVRLERLNLDAASFRQLHTEAGGDPDAIRARVLEIIPNAARCTIRSPVRAGC